MSQWPRRWHLFKTPHDSVVCCCTDGLHDATFRRSEPELPDILNELEGRIVSAVAGIAATRALLRQTEAVL